MEDGAIGPTGQVMVSVGAKDALRAAAEKIGYARFRAKPRAGGDAHIRKGMGIEGHYARPTLQMRKRGAQIVRRGGAHMAKILRNNQVGTKLAQQFKIDAVKALAAFEEFAHLAVDGRRAFCVRDS
jgi:hypothetical protein